MDATAPHIAQKHSVSKATTGKSLQFPTFKQFSLTVALFKVTLFIELIWPILLLLIVAFIKRASPPVIRGPCYYQPLELPNGDFLSFMKSFICMLDYKCYDKSRAKETEPYQNQ